MGKRYAIVRVDNKCPVNLEEDISTVDRIKMFDCIGKRQCGDCRYGDTKEQLIKKVAQVIKKEYDCNLKEDAPLAVILDIIIASREELAKEIIEFLGVK